MFLGGVITCLFVSGICFMFGYLVWKKKDLSFIAGCNEKTCSGDKEKLAHLLFEMVTDTSVMESLKPS